LHLRCKGLPFPACSRPSPGQTCTGLFRKFGSAILVKAKKNCGRGSSRGPSSPILLSHQPSWNRVGRVRERGGPAVPIRCPLKDWQRDVSAVHAVSGSPGVLPPARAWYLAGGCSTSERRWVPARSYRRAAARQHMAGRRPGAQLQAWRRRGERWWRFGGEGEACAVASGDVKAGALLQADALQPSRVTWPRF
jgi:hypothetical protein